MGERAFSVHDDQEEIGQAKASQFNKPFVGSSIR
jgi:hypothetical protein